MIRSKLSARSCNFSHTFRRHRGFTFVELMISTLLVAIGTTLAIPSYRDMVEKRQLTNSAEQLAAFVNSTQSIASRTNQIVTVSYSRTANDDWCIGVIAGATACDCDETDSSASNFCTIDSQAFILNESLSGGSNLVTSVAGDGAYAFDPIRGLLLDPADSLNMVLNSNSGDFALNLMVNGTGRVVLCSTDADHAIPGYELCP